MTCKIKMVMLQQPQQKDSLSQYSFIRSIIIHIYLLIFSKNLFQKISNQNLSEKKYISSELLSYFVGKNEFKFRTSKKIRQIKISCLNFSYDILQIHILCKDYYFLPFTFNPLHSLIYKSFKHCIQVFKR